MKFEYEDGKVYRPASIDRIGPVIVVTENCRTLKFTDFGFEED